MDILKQLMSNPGFHHIAEKIIGYMDRETTLNLAGNAGNHELLSDEEQKFLMKASRRRMFHEAQLICDKTYHFIVYPDAIEVEKSIFQMFPFFVKALQELRTSEEFISFKQLCEILSLLEDVINEETCDYGYYGTDTDRFKLACLYECSGPDDQDATGPKDMIEVLKLGLDVHLSEYWVLQDMMS